MQHAVRLIPVLAIAAHLSLTLWISATFNIWIDEYYSLHTTGGGLGFAVKQALEVENHSPIYFVILWFWRCLNESVLWARLLSGVFILGMLAVAARLSRVLFPNMHAGWFVCLAAFNPLVIYAATEIRATALTLLVSSLLMLFFVQGYVVTEPRKRSMWAYAIVSVLALYVHYYLGFILLANGLALLIARRWRLIAAYYATMAAVAVCLLPMAFFVSGHVASQAGAIAAEPQSLFSDIRYIFMRMQRLVWPGLPPDGLARWIVPAVLAVGLGAGMVLRRRSITATQSVIWVGTFVLMAAFTVLVARFGMELLLNHHSAPLWLPALLSIYSVIHLFNDRERRKILVGWSLIIGICTGAALYTVYKPAAKLGDWKRVAAYLESNESPDEPILVFTSEKAWPLDYYYKGTNPIVPVPYPDDLTSYDMEKHVIHSEEDVAAALDTVGYRAQRVWVVSSCEKNCHWLGVDFNAEALTRYLDREYVLEGQQPFHGTLIRKYARPFALED